jgi:hypothetical protein
MAGCGGIFHGVARHHDSEYRGACHFGRSPRGSAEHEVCACQLHLEPGGFYSHQRLDGRPLRDPPGVRLRDWPLHPGFISLRHIDRHPLAGRLPHPAGLWWGHDGAGGPVDPGANVCQVRAHPRHELRCHSRAGWPHAGSRRGWPDRGIPALAVHLLCEHPHRHCRFIDGLSPPAGLSRRRQPPARYCRAHPVRIRHRPAVVRARDICTP